MSKPKLPNHVWAVMRLQHLSLATEQTCVQWIKRAIFFHKMRYPQEIGVAEIRYFLSHHAANAKSDHQHKSKCYMLFFFRRQFQPRRKRALAHLVERSRPKMGVDILHNHGVEYLYPKSQRGGAYESALSKSDRVATRDARHAPPSDVAMGPQHGYGISQAIRTNSGEVLQVDTGSLYPALHRLERHKWIRSEWTISENNQRVKLYRLTVAGKKQLATERSRWEQVTEAVAGILNPARKESKA